jgi:hypothetical protein
VYAKNMSTVLTPENVAVDGTPPEFYKSLPLALIPPGCKVSFVGEGAANAVFQLQLPENIAPEWRAFLTGVVTSGTNIVNEIIVSGFNFLTLKLR